MDLVPCVDGGVKIFILNLLNTLLEALANVSFHTSLEITAHSVGRHHGDCADVKSLILVERATIHRSLLRITLGWASTRIALYTSVPINIYVSTRMGQLFPIA